ncbi:hypothetical protein F503_03328 [Ophiostoma piceae UAMH 11346]|uniref:Uncharacterized protein n=1 Tax=Ophiostoma piceae (strain UAMH 11346) TaxID=1262450 RepID=S3C4X5_OPHP1|nr:hypothetical protein F503_03328 [Ophiostoma piceae UAMH 11346]
MGHVLYDSSDSIPGPDKCGGDNHDDDYCGGTLDYTYHSSQSRQSQSQSAGSPPRRDYGLHSNRRQPAYTSLDSIDVPAQRQKRHGRSRGSSSGSAPPPAPPSLMRQDAFCARGSLESQEKELHRLGVYDGHPTHARHATRPTPQDKPSYNTPHEPPMTATVIYELEDGSTQGSTDSSYASHAQQAYRATYADGYHDKNQYADRWTMQ